MIPRHRTATHPGEILREEFLRPMEVTQVQLARHLGVPLQRVNEIVTGKRGITAATAHLLGQALGTAPEFWMNLQAQYDLTVSRPPRAVKPLRKAA